MMRLNIFNLNPRLARLALAIAFILVFSMPILTVYADQQVEVSICDTDFVGTTWSGGPKSFTVDVGKISNAKQIFIEVSLSSKDDKWLRVIYIVIDGTGVNAKDWDVNKGHKYTAVVSPSGNNLRYDVTSMVKGKSSVKVEIYLYTLKDPYTKASLTWHVTAKFIGVLGDEVVVPNPSGSESFAIPTYMASGGLGLALLGVAYYLKRRED